MEATPKPVQAPLFSIDEWIKSLNQKEVKIQISSCLDECMLGYNKRMPAIRIASKDVDETV